MAESSETDFTKHREKHLEMLQKVVDRLANASIAMKRYCLVVIAAAIGIARLSQDTETLYGAALMVVVFWLMDSRYLQQEKWVRDLYDAVRLEPPEKRPDYRITPPPEVRKTTSLWRRLFSWSTAVLYMPLLILLLIMLRSM